ncbi:MAG TPA: TetR family transcriptional regulator [Nocardioidaceae bacterium]|nr:TetR family transcriptional regulator [Nocardioidaceae bacterium]
MVPAARERRGPGRRPGSPDTRGEIVEAARREFGAHGYDRTSMRAVARAAGVDPALIHHYFESKEDLLLSAMEVPFDPREVLGAVVDGPQDRIGERLVRAVLGQWDDPQRQRRLLTIVRTAIASEAASHLLRDGLLRMILDQIAAIPGIDDARRRGNLVASQLVGLLMTRYVVGIEPLASMPADEVVARIGPTVQRYLFD